MKYPESFVRDVKERFSDWPEMIQKLDAGSEFVGRYLDDSCQTGVSNFKVLEAKTLEEVQAIARRNMTVLELYSRWQAIYREQKLDVR